MEKSFRLFVGNIPQGTSEAELRTEFGAYGVVESVEVKTKPNALSGAADTFGFVSLRTEDRVVSQCIKEFREQKYKGVFLNVSRAKESFLDRLKREREEAGAQKQKNVPSSTVDSVKQSNDEKPGKAAGGELPTLPSLGQADESSSSESSDSDSDEEEEVKETSKKTSAPSAGPESNKKQEPELVKKWNQETYIEHGKLKIVPITGQVKEVIDRSKTHKTRSADGKQLSEKARIADEKRKQGLTKLSSAYEQQKLAIKNALSGEGLGSKRKFAFSDDEAEDEPRTGKRKVALFDGDGDEDDDGFEGNFKVRKQLSGQEGQKLYEMQTAYQGDNRFRLDDRFLDKDAVQKDDQPKSKKNKITEKERLKQLEILSNVTGKPIASDKRNEQRNAPQMHRFDPSQRNELGQESSEDNRSKLATIKQAERRENDYKVTDEKFYKVSDNLTGLLTGASGESNGQGGGGFSLLSMFGKASTAVDDEVESNQQEHYTKGDRPKDSGARFKHESSESEEEPEENGDQRADDRTNDDEVAKNIAQRKAGYYSRQGIWKEKFFFLPNDSRFDDGRKFFGILLSTQNVPQTTGDGKPAENGNAERKEHTVDDLKKIYKKRRQREGKNMKMKSKLGFKVMNRRNVKK